jgi:mutator protein MutT
MRTNKRACAVIIKDGKILVFHRFKDGREYFAFPGGGVEEGETEEEAVIREIKEELCLDIKVEKLLFVVEIHRKEFAPHQYFYLVGQFSGTPKINGVGDEMSMQNNRYIIEWISFKDIAATKNLYPDEGRVELLKYLSKIK